MIDTIRLRLHSCLDTKPVFVNGVKHPIEVEHVCKGHYELLRKMLTYKGKFYETTSFIEESRNVSENIDSEDVLHLEYSKNLQGHYLNKQIVRFQSENDVKKRNLRTLGKMSLTSSESDLTFSINYEAGFIDFEFSVPKYLYHHNLAQFIPQSKSKYFNNPSNRIIANSWQTQISILHLRFMKFIKKFISDIDAYFSLDVGIDLNYLELVRIDLCFNQYFKSKDEALKYLSMQKKINNKYNRTSYQSNKPYDTSIAFKSKTSAFFKIYHKGTEYETVGDMKKHIKINFDFYEKTLKKRVDVPVFASYKETHKFLLEKVFTSKNDKVYVPPHVDKDKLLKFNRDFKKNQIFDVKFLLSEMNKVLRYEVTIRPKYMAYHYKTKFFRKDCPYFSEYKKIHNKVRSIYDSRNTKKRKKTLGKYEMDIYHDYKKWLQRSLCFLFTDSHVVKTFNRVSVGKGVNDFDPVTKDYEITNVSNYQYSSSLNDKDVSVFSPGFLEFLCTQFYDMFNHFQIEELIQENDFIFMLKEYNSKADENAERYNSLNAHECIDYLGKPILKGSTIVKKATQLLTQKRMRELHLKKVSVPILSTLYSHLEAGKSLHEIRNEMNITSSSFSRYKKDLELFNISEQSQVIKQKIEPINDFSYYYSRQQELFYRESFFSQPKYLMYA